MHPASVHLSEVGVNAGGRPGGRGLGLRLVLRVNFRLPPRETRDLKSEPPVT